ITYLTESTRTGLPMVAAMPKKRQLRMHSLPPRKTARIIAPRRGKIMADKSREGYTLCEIKDRRRQPPRQPSSSGSSTLSATASPGANQLLPDVGRAIVFKGHRSCLVQVFDLGHAQLCAYSVVGDVLAQSGSGGLDGMNGETGSLAGKVSSSASSWFSLSFFLRCRRVSGVSGGCLSFLRPGCCRSLRSWVAMPAARVWRERWQPAFCRVNPRCGRRARAVAGPAADGRIRPDSLRWRDDGRAFAGHRIHAWDGMLATPSPARTGAPRGCHPTAESRSQEGQGTARRACENDHPRREDTQRAARTNPRRPGGPRHDRG